MGIYTRVPKRAQPPSAVRESRFCGEVRNDSPAFWRFKQGAFLSRASQPPQHDPAHRRVDRGHRGLRHPLVALAEPPRLSKPWISTVLLDEGVVVVSKFTPDAPKRQSVRVTGTVRQFDRAMVVEEVGFELRQRYYGR